MQDENENGHKATIILFTTSYQTRI